MRLLGSLFGGGSGRFWLNGLPATLAGAGEELLHAAGHLLGAIDGEGEFGDVAYAHAVAKLRAYVGAGGHEAFEGGGFLLFVTVDGDEDAGGFAAWCEDYVRYIAWSDAWIGEFAFEHGTYFFREGIGDSVAVVRSGSLLGHRFSYSGKRLRIPKSILSP